MPTRSLCPALTYDHGAARWTVASAEGDDRVPTSETWGAALEAHELHGRKEVLVSDVLRSRA